MSKREEKFKILLFAIIGIICVVSFMIDAKREPVSVSEKESLRLEEVLDPVSWKPTPNIRFIGYGEDDFSLESLKGKVVLLNFWTSWCPPCVKEFPGLLRLIKKFDGEIILVAITNDETEEEIEEYLDRFKDEFADELESPYLKVAWDKEKIIASDIFHTEMYPETIIVSRKGLMAKKIVGDIDWEGEDITTYLERLLRVENN